VRRTARAGRMANARTHARLRTRARARIAHKRAARNENAQNVLQSTLVQLGGLYAVSQACLLSIFVPQKCPEYIGCVTFGDADGEGRTPEDCLWSPWFTYTSDTPDGHLCSMKGALSVLLTAADCASAS
jgi:hypothetical protein